VRPAIAPAGPRALLRRLRDIMADPGTAQERLDTVVSIIANNMVAEVCSIYLVRAGEVLELFATEGLNRDAVHRTRLRVGEGLVGDIAARARPLSLPDAQAHPRFAYRPETGEEIYQSLMGVPILRGGRVIGVLVVQNRTARHYSDEEIEALQTVAMVLAEMVNSGELIGRDELFEAAGNATRPQYLEGRVLAEGLAQGIAVLHEPRIEISKTIAEDPEREKMRLDRALRDLRASVDRVLAGDDFVAGGEHRDIFETYRLFTRDRGWLDRLNEALESGLTAEAAVQRAQVVTRARMAEIGDPSMRERLDDLEDLANRLSQYLADEDDRAGHRLPQDAVVVARTMGPAELLDYDRDRLRAVVLEEGSPTSHVAIVARALDIPLLGNVDGLIGRVEPGDSVIVDGEHGQVFIRPGEEIRQAFVQNLAARAERRAKYAALRDLPAVTRDGVPISLNVNAGLLVDLPHLDETGADGIGLFRTELQFMGGHGFPGVDAQADLYARILDHAGDRPVVFRTFDVGGDKTLSYVGHGKEENPALGWRAIRISLDRPALLRTQVRALLRAAADRRLDLMFPMVAEVAEFEAARAILDLEIGRLREAGAAAPRDVRVGTMLEVPALAWQLPALLPRVDFVSIGSNDLRQFLFASDRSNPLLANRYDPLSPGLLSLVRAVVVACEAASVPLALCGEMAGRPLEAMALLGLGLRSISMAPSAVGPVKEMVRSLDLGSLARYLVPLLERPDHSLRGKLLSFARDHGIVI